MSCSSPWLWFRLLRLSFTWINLFAEFRHHSAVEWWRNLAGLQFKWSYLGNSTFSCSFWSCLPTVEIADSTALLDSPLVIGWTYKTFIRLIAKVKFTFSRFYRGPFREFVFNNSELPGFHFLSLCRSLKYEHSAECSVCFRNLDNFSSVKFKNLYSFVGHNWMPWNTVRRNSHQKITLWWPYNRYYS